MPPELKNILEDLCTWAEKEKSINRVYLFGSYARNEAGPKSDLDIAIEINPNEEEQDVFSIWVDQHPMYLNALSQMIPVDVHLELLDNGYTKRIQNAVDTDGRLVYERKSKASG